eukprot:Rmarinus@m.5941
MWEAATVRLSKLRAFDLSIGGDQLKQVYVKILAGSQLVCKTLLTESRSFYHLEKDVTVRLQGSEDIIIELWHHHSFLKSDELLGYAELFVRSIGEFELENLELDGGYNNGRVSVQVEVFGSRIKSELRKPEKAGKTAAMRFLVNIDGVSVRGLLSRKASLYTVITWNHRRKFATETLPGDDNGLFTWKFCDAFTYRVLPSESELQAMKYDKDFSKIARSLTQAMVCELLSKRVIEVRIMESCSLSDDRVLGHAQLDMLTVASGPSSHSLLLTDVEGNALNARVSIKIHMDQVFESQVSLRSLAIRGPPGICNLSVKGLLACPRGSTYATLVSSGVSCSEQATTKRPAEGVGVSCLTDGAVDYLNLRAIEVSSPHSLFRSVVHLTFYKESREMEVGPKIGLLPEIPPLSEFRGECFIPIRKIEHRCSHANAVTASMAEVHGCATEQVAWYKFEEPIIRNGCAIGILRGRVEVLGLPLVEQLPFGMNCHLAILPSSPSLAATGVTPSMKRRQTSLFSFGFGEGTSVDRGWRDSLHLVRQFVQDGIFGTPAAKLPTEIETLREKTKEFEGYCLSRCYKHTFPLVLDMLDILRSSHVNPKRALLYSSTTSLAKGREAFLRAGELLLEHVDRAPMLQRPKWYEAIMLVLTRGEMEFTDVLLEATECGGSTVSLEDNVHAALRSRDFLIRCLSYMVHHLLLDCMYPALLEFCMEVASLALLRIPVFRASVLEAMPRCENISTWRSMRMHLREQASVSPAGMRERRPSLCPSIQLPWNRRPSPTPLGVATSPDASYPDETQTCEVGSGCEECEWLGSLEGWGCTRRWTRARLTEEFRKGNPSIFSWDELHGFLDSVCSGSLSTPSSSETVIPHRQTSSVAVNATVFSLRNWRASLRLLSFPGSVFPVFVSSYLRLVVSSSAVDSGVIVWETIPGYVELVSVLFTELRCVWPAELRPALVEACCMALRNPSLADPFTQILLKHTSLHNIKDVHSTLETLDLWYSSLAKASLRLPPTFSFAVLNQALDKLLSSLSFQIQLMALRFIYHQLPLFSVEAYVCVCRDILLPRLETFLCSWCDDVRVFTSVLLVYRILPPLFKETEQASRIDGIEGVIKKLRQRNRCTGTQEEVAHIDDDTKLGTRSGSTPDVTAESRNGSTPDVTAEIMLIQEQRNVLSRIIRDADSRSVMHSAVPLVESENGHTQVYAEVASKFFDTILSIADRNMATFVPEETARSTVYASRGLRELDTILRDYDRKCVTEETGRPTLPVLPFDLIFPDLPNNIN